MTAVAKPWRSSIVPCGLGLWAAAIAVAPRAEWKLALLVPVLGLGVIAWSILKPGRWLYLFFLCAIALPPLPIAGGDSGIHLAPLAAGLGIFAGLLRLKEWRKCDGPLPLAFLIFMTVLLCSAGLAAWYSGPMIGLGSMVRVLLLGLGVYVFFYSYAAPRIDSPGDRTFTAFLFYVGAAAALFACVDFYYQLPAPAGYGPQFVWLDQGVFRRAQGLFYEASTLGNFCAFFLSMVLVALFRPHRELPVPRWALLLGGAIFSAALIFSYSRGSILNVVAAACALIYARRAGTKRAMLLFGGLAIAAAVVVQFLFPAFSASYWSRITASLYYASSTPDSVLSGRLTNWTFLINFLAHSPWHAVLGIGYKTLPYSDYAGAAVIADNTYLGLLVETGAIGLAAFLALNGLILRTALRAARSGRADSAFFGEWIFCFWVGETIQMLSGDLITYWRVLPVYFWVLGVAARRLRDR